MSTISASIARQTLPAQLDRVEAGEEVAISRHGRVVAVLISPDRLRSRRAEQSWRDADALHARLLAARADPLTATIDSARADALIQEIQDSRPRR
ncbi:type II toxin-antitoxin system Phd/YefM family antitoxin [Microbacterium sp.]|uniref:type II toxin-antitoxin system Phd/YefM family antitoxin n=1 Tax=Microbacterium sp. TaxID=51671 RepID=UPI0039E47C16